MGKTFRNLKFDKDNVKRILKKCFNVEEHMNDKYLFSKKKEQKIKEKGKTKKILKERI